jgi:GTP-binding protein HflX
VLLLQKIAPKILLFPSKWLESLKMIQQNFLFKAILVHIDLPQLHFTHEDIIEFQELVKADNIQSLTLVTGTRSAPNIKYFVGSGKAEEIRDLVVAVKADLVIFNHNLSPAQERNLEKLFNCHVLDRTGLILDIFAKRARTFEGRLQVELAQLERQATRLVRGWTHLERQRGGIGMRSGPGETQLETDRRLIRGRIKNIKARLVKVHSQRQLHRKARQKSEVPTISLVGYTNAGKSTLFNKLATADVYTANLLFATLDSTLRRILLPEVGEAILVDTVGFIRHLPHELVAAFRATLEETKLADLLLHVIDLSDPEWREKIKAVNNVLEEIGAQDVPQLLVYNKIDLIDGEKAAISYAADDKPQFVKISAANGLGIELLLQALQELLVADIEEYTVNIESGNAELRAALYAKGKVLSETADENGNIKLVVRMRRKDFNKL